MLWLIGDFQAVRLRPIVVGDNTLQVRVGLRWSVAIPYGQIRQARLRGRGEAMTRRSAGYLSAALLVDPQLILELDCPLRVQGPYGISKEVSRVGLAVDDFEAFRAALVAKRVSV